MDPSPTQLGAAIDRYGLPLCMLAVVAFVFWRLARWVRPYGDQLAKATIALVETTRENNIKMASALATSTETQSGLAKNQERLADNQQSIHALVEKMDRGSKIDEIHAHVVSGKKGTA